MWQNRIVGHDEVDPRDLVANPHNWRAHSLLQAKALQQVLDEVGWVQNVLVNVSTGHIVDGHLRVALALQRGEKVPVTYISLTEEEERLVLATFDPLGALADRDASRLQSLLDSLDLSGVIGDLICSLFPEKQAIPSTALDTPRELTYVLRVGPLPPDEARALSSELQGRGYAVRLARK